MRGSGKWFSAGADLKDASRWGNAARPLDEQREIAALGYRMARAWEELPQITIAAIEGYAIGGGLALVAALDWRVIATDAFVSLPEIALGIPLTWGTLPRLVNLVGPARAKRLTILCERDPGRRSAGDGPRRLRRAARQGARDGARDVAKQVLALPRNSVRMTKESVNAYASIGAHAASHMAHDQVQLAAAQRRSEAPRAKRSRLGGRRAPVRHDPGRARRR